MSPSDRSQFEPMITAKEAVDSMGGPQRAAYAIWDRTGFQPSANDVSRWVYRNRIPAQWVRPVAVAMRVPAEQLLPLGPRDKWQPAPERPVL